MSGNVYDVLLKNSCFALACVARLFGRHPVHGKVAKSELLMADVEMCDTVLIYN